MQCWHIVVTLLAASGKETCPCRGVPVAGLAGAPDAVIVVDVHVERLRARRITSSKDLLAMAVVDGEGVLALHAVGRGSP